MGMKYPILRLEIGEIQIPFKGLYPEYIKYNLSSYCELYVYAVRIANIKIVWQNACIYLIEFNVTIANWNQMSVHNVTI